MENVEFNVIALTETSGIHLVIQCPFCAKIHIHGAGKKGEPLAYGGQAPHCAGLNPPGYCLVPPPSGAVELALRTNLKRRAKLEKGVTL